MINSHTTKDHLQVLHATVVGNNAPVGDFGIAASALIVRRLRFEGLSSLDHPNTRGYVIEHDSAADETSVFFLTSKTHASIRGTARFFATPSRKKFSSLLFCILPKMLFVADQKDIKSDF